MCKRILTAEETLDNALLYANTSMGLPGGEQVEAFLINNNDLIFEERVTMNCFYCEKYGRNWRCPPNLPQIDYKKVHCME